MTADPIADPSGPASLGAQSRRGGMIAWGVVRIVLGVLIATALIGLAFSYLGALQQDLLARPGPARGAAPPRGRRWTSRSSLG